MAPRTFCWFKRECLSPDTECINLVALVFENSELFEAEAAELSIEESDDSSSLLIRNDSLFGEISAEECGTLPRSLHLGLSAHSLATTSVVTPTHHAQTIEYNLISTSTSDARINPNETNSDVYKPLSSLSLCNSHQLQDFISTLPVHVLNAVSLSITTPRSPSLWPLHLLAYADSPTFVRAVTSDLKRFCTCFNGYRSENSDLVDVISCDLASDLTTCNLSCCQAEVDLFQCTTPSLADCQVNYSNPSLSPPALISYDNLPNNHKLVPLLCDHNQISVSDELGIVILPLSGLRPDLLQDNQLCHSTFTAVYLLLVSDDLQSGVLSNQNVSISGAIRNHARNSRISCNRSCIDNTMSDTFDHSANPTVILALLVQMLPSNQFPCPITIKHKFSPLSMPTLSTLSHGQQFTVLVAMVDLLVSKTDHADVQFNAILHQRLHYLPDLKFELALHNQM